MKCPKCQYLTYDQGDRCRNCGYDFALSTDLYDLDLPIRTGDEPIGPLADLTLGASTPGFDEPPPPPVVADPAPLREQRRVARDAAPSGELPLFHGRPAADAPLVTLPASPRAPMSVRKSTPAKLSTRRAKADEPTLDLDGETDAVDHAGRRASRPAASAAGGAAVEPVPAPVGARLLGAAIDLTLMATIDAVVLYLTLLATSLTFAEVGRIPIAPFAAFLALLNGGYIAAFTAAGGQSFGKMAAGTRVVSSEAHAWGDRVTLGQSSLRAVMYLLSALPAGLGFAPALVGPDHRALHDRLAHTRVVKA